MMDAPTGQRHLLRTNTVLTRDENENEPEIHSRYLKSNSEKIMVDKKSTDVGEVNSLKNISLVLVFRRDPPANTYAIPGGKYGCIFIYNYVY
jgi:hypothetical protein